MFAVLPMGVRGQAEEGEIVRGSEPGAPVNANMKRKLIQTTLVATVVWAIVCAIIIFGWLDWRDFALFDME